jgi:hypothetical protein
MILGMKLTLIVLLGGTGMLASCTAVDTATDSWSSTERARTATASTTHRRGTGAPTHSDPIGAGLNPGGTGTTGTGTGGFNRPPNLR